MTQCGALSAVSPAVNTELNEIRELRKLLKFLLSPTLIQVTRSIGSVVTSPRVGTFAWRPGLNLLCGAGPWS